MLHLNENIEQQPINKYPYINWDSKINDNYEEFLKKINIEYDIETFKSAYFGTFK